MVGNHNFQRIKGGRGGVIWITGYSGAGKTTVGRIVRRHLERRGATCVLLDGDDLRSIFGGSWGYERQDRVELANVYFRLCSHLSAQGIIVIISAIALYDEVDRWVRQNIPSSIQVYLRVSEQERRRRDSRTKNVYPQIGDIRRMYDDPASPDLIYDNEDGHDVEDIARSIANAFVDRYPQANADHGRATHWQEFYTQSPGIDTPTMFARHVGQCLSINTRILDIGCGNGRDSAYFAQVGHTVVGLDVSSAAIELCAERHRSLPIRFIKGVATELASDFKGYFDVVYSRFCLHAMTDTEEDDMLLASFSLLQPKGEIFIECRSINDPLARKGEIISPTERIYGHYRRFIVREELCDRLEHTGFEIIESVEGRGFALYGDEDPVVIRVRARKGAEFWKD